MNKCGIYLRKSRKEDGIGMSLLEERKNMGIKFCSDNSLDFEVYNEGIKGSDDKDKKELYRLINDIEEGNISVIWCWESSRLFREDRSIRFNIERICVENDCRLFGDGRWYDFNRSEDKFSFGIISEVNKFEKERLKERMLVGRRSRVNRGLRFGGRKCLGYKWDIIEGEKRLVVNENEVELVKEVFKRYNKKGESLKSVWEYFLKIDDIDKRLKSWSNIRNIICNSLYIGKYSGKIDGEVYNIEREDWRIISDDLFNKCNNKREENRKKISVKPNLKNSYVLNEKLFCGECGSRMMGRVVNSKVIDGIRYSYRYYNCDRRSLKVYDKKKDKIVKKCNSKSSIRVEIIEELIIGLLIYINKESKKLREDFKKRRKKLEDNIESDIKNIEKKVKYYETEIKKSDKSIDNGKMLFVEGDLDKKRYDEIKRKYENKKKGYIKRINELLVELNNIGDDDENSVWLKMYFKELDKFVRRKDYNRILRIVKNILFNKKENGYDLILVLDGKYMKDKIKYKWDKELKESSYILEDGMDNIVLKDLERSKIRSEGVNYIIEKYKNSNLILSNYIKLILNQKKLLFNLYLTVNIVVIDKRYNKIKYKINGCWINDIKYEY